MRQLIAAAVQISCTDDVEGNLDKLERHIREASRRGAGLVVLPELFEGIYFCIDEDKRHTNRALPLEGHPTIARMAALARETGVVLPLSLFERDGAGLYNTLVMIDADGKVLGHYRKSHIPDSSGYCEKLYFADGDTGFRVFETAAGKVGAGVCWDQWFPEAARAMVLMGAEILIYPTAIGSEPSWRGWDSRDHWQRVMQGHAGANLTPLVAANRIGTERGQASEITFYGSSFIADHTGAKIAEADRVSDGVISAALDLDEIAAAKRSWGVFRDRRPDLYGVLLEPTPDLLLATQAA